MDSCDNCGKINEKSFQMGSKIDPKSRKSVPGGTPKWRQEAKMIKRRVGANSAALLEAIFEENGLQDGGQNRAKINTKVIQNFVIFCFFFNIILEGFLMKNQWKIYRKMMLKSIQLIS